MGRVYHANHDISDEFLCSTCHDISRNEQAIILMIRAQTHACPNLGCIVLDSVGIDNHNLIIHLQHCEYRKSEYPSCHESIVHAHLQRHLRDTCPNRTVKCNKCNDTMSFNQATQVE